MKCLYLIFELVIMYVVFYMYRFMDLMLYLPYRDYVMLCYVMFVVIRDFIYII